MLPASCSHADRQLIDDVLAGTRSVRMQPLSLVTVIAGWLRDHWPRSVAAIVLLKGTNGYDEEIFRTGRLLAISDQELARIGDPACEWAQSGISSATWSSMDASSGACGLHSSSTGNSPGWSSILLRSIIITSTTDRFSC